MDDTTVWDDGSVERRAELARLVARNRTWLTYDDMPGGTELRLRADGFSFSPAAVLGPTWRVSGTCVRAVRLGRGHQHVCQVEFNRLGKTRCDRW